jgi:hypothetical protein
LTVVSTRPFDPIDRRPIDNRLIPLYTSAINEYPGTEEDVIASFIPFNIDNFDIKLLEIDFTDLVPKLKG